MRSAKKTAFTLLEMMISIVILSIIMIFLYKTSSGLTHSNKTYTKKLQQFTKLQQTLKTIYLDVSLSLPKSMTITKVDIDYDRVYFQSSNSIHNRINPYIGYQVYENKLYRIESRTPLEYPLSGDEEMVIDEIPNVKHFQLADSENFVLLMANIEGEDIIIKIRKLNN